MRIVSFVAMAALLAGCQAAGGYPPPGMTRPEALKSVETDSAVGAEAAYDAAADPEVRRQIRNRIVRARLYVADVNYNDFARNLSTEQKAFAVGSDIAVLGLAGAGTLAKSARTATRLAAASSGVLGARSAIDKEIYFDKTLPAIVAQMDASRRTVYATIATGLARSDADYSLLQAKADLETYYIAGTIPGALTAITKEAGKQSAVADQKIERIVEYPYSFGNISKRILKYRKPDDKTVDVGHESAMFAWLHANTNVPTVGECILGACTEAEKAQMAKDLAIP